MTHATPGMRRYHWWQAHRGLAIIAAVIAVVAVSVAAYVVWPRTEPPVHITDGSHVFSADLARVEALISAENSQVRASGHYVSIAFVDIMAPRKNIDPVPPDSIRHDLEGAYLAQMAWNHPIGKQPATLVQLLLADEGSAEANWLEAAHAIEEKVDSPDHLVAAAGLGISVENTRKLIKELSDHNIAIVAGAITGDSMTKTLDGDTPVPGMVRVAQTNTDEASAAVKYLDNDKTIPESPTVLLVQDQNEGDDFAKTLGTAFARSIQNDSARQYKLTSPGMFYNSRLSGAGEVLKASAERVCETRADVVYFAGRGNDLQGFLAGLATRSCAGERALTVVGAPDIARQTNTQLWVGQDANMTVIFTGLVSAEMWTKDKPAASGAIIDRFTGTCAYCFPTLFPGERLDDGTAVLSHDAVWTVERAILELSGANPGISLSAGMVAQQLNQLKVPGASGWICAFDTNHNPVNKAIPVMSIDQNGHLTYKALSSATGVPPTACGS
ncbi:hypothetical protein M8542_30655 [Amycolatopsis sp. OK19-0408]|uniref:Uncharacterized protein n=1 Tax=Amycolatopsis iheyensis TaxID=2945988 RepID=A0A9X2NEI2_9PSEU|nr:hypothetical protein [Amycolatopsis iheyensis]MCR6487199.1 hypothetical protein [Amycolatopsis iheyensis]